MYVYITMGLHRKAGFHWRKRGFTVFAEKFGKPLVIGDKGTSWVV